MDIPAARSADNERGRRAPAVVGFGDHVDDLVKSAADEVHELELGDGTHAGERCAKGRTHDGGLGDGRVDNAFRAEAVNQAVSDFERTAVNADVLTNAENTGITIHFFLNSLADGFEIGEGRHVSLYSWPPG